MNTDKVLIEGLKLLALATAITLVLLTLPS